jgi:hypothetical protein
MNRVDRLERDRLLGLARRRALNQLADLHPAEYVILIDAECAELGIEPPGTRPDGRPPG